MYYLYLRDLYYFFHIILIRYFWVFIYSLSSFLYKNSFVFFIKAIIEAETLNFMNIINIMELDSAFIITSENYLLKYFVFSEINMLLHLKFYNLLL